jgi:DNA-binding NarL/FixJ family response regulator
MRDLDAAREDLSCCLRIVSDRETGDCSSPERQLFMMVAQTELARAHGAYLQSREYAESALALARAYSDRHTQAALLIDLGIYASWCSRPADVQVALQGLREIACEMRVPHVYNICRYFERYLIESLPGNTLQTWPVPAISPPALVEPLSERELEVLRLVAEGLSNRQIAERLVVTRSTVKKHLEHIYSKLDAHSRTAASARARGYKLLA